MDKKRIWSACTEQLENKMKSSRAHLESLQASSSNETKSSAGDKFETSREMMQQEINKADLHFSQLTQHFLELKALSYSIQKHIIDRGSFVISNMGSFYISIALGKIKMEDGYFYAISMDSPMADALKGKTKGDNVTVNGRNVIVKEVF